MKRINLWTITVLFFALPLFISCSKNDDSKDNEDSYEEEKYTSPTISVSTEDPRTKIIVIRNYSNNQKWWVLFNDSKDETLLDMFPREGIGNGSIVVRVKDATSYSGIIHIYYTNKNKEMKVFSPLIVFNFDPLFE